MIKSFLFHLPVESCWVSNNGRGAGLGRGTPHLLPLPARQKDAYTEPSVMGLGKQEPHSPFSYAAAKAGAA